MTYVEPHALSVSCPTKPYRRLSFLKSLSILLRTKLYQKLTMTSLKISPSLDLNSKTVIVAGCSKSLVDNFAVDWIIESLALKRIAILSSTEVEAMVQPAAFSTTDSHFTTSFEIYGSFESSIVVVQIRSKIYNRELLSEQLIQYCGDHHAKEVLVVGASDACYLSGEALEKNDRFRSAAKARDSLTHIEVSDIHSGGLVKSLLQKTSKKLPISAILVLVSGLGYMETRILSEQLALHVLNDLKVDIAGSLIEPISIKQLVANPPISLEVGRIV